MFLYLLIDMVIMFPIFLPIFEQRIFKKLCLPIVHQQKPNFYNKKFVFKKKIIDSISKSGIICVCTWIKDLLISWDIAVSFEYAVWLVIMLKYSVYCNKLVVLILLHNLHSVYTNSNELLNWPTTTGHVGGLG